MSREKQVYSKVRVTLMSESCPLDQKRSPCVTFAQGPQECHGAHSCAGEIQSHSPAVTVPQEHLLPELGPKGLLYPVREIIFPEDPHQAFNTSIQLQFAKMQRHFIINVYWGHSELDLQIYMGT